MGLIVREYVPDDAAALRTCVVALQDFERGIDPLLRAGETMADDYCERIRARCRETGGRVFVAEQDGAVIGFTAIFAREPFTELDEPPGTYALVADLVVLAPYRRRGIGRRLLQRAEQFARAEGARELRIGVLAENGSARRLYLAAEFLPYQEILAKRW